MEDQPFDEHGKPNGPIVITVRHPEWASSLRLSADISGHMISYACQLWGAR